MDILTSGYSSKSNELARLTVYPYTCRLKSEPNPGLKGVDVRTEGDRCEGFNDSMNTNFLKWIPITSNCQFPPP